MKILYIGPYRQLDGWGEAARDFLQSLVLTGHDITLRPVYLGQTYTKDIPANLVALEQKQSNQYDVILQQVLPPCFSPNYDAKNIGMFFSETGNLQNTMWPYYCNLMDEIWVSSEVEVNNIIKSGVKPNKVKKLPLGIDTAKFERSYPKIPSIPDDTFNFYYIGEYVPRKNITALLIAFHLEFRPEEPVNLIIKTNKGNMPPQELAEMVDKEIGTTKTFLRLYPNNDLYKKEILIPNRLTQDELYSLHTSCDCFVIASHGEAWCKPAMDALGFGNTPIVTDQTGMTEFIDSSVGWLIPGVESPVLCAEAPAPGIYTARETWRSIHIPALRQLLREAYNDRSKSALGLEKVYDFSYQNIASKINQLLST